MPDNILRIDTIIFFKEYNLVLIGRNAVGKTLILKNIISVMSFQFLLYFLHLSVLLSSLPTFFLFSSSLLWFSYFTGWLLCERHCIKYMNILAVHFQPITSWCFSLFESKNNKPLLWPFVRKGTYSHPLIYTGLIPGSRGYSNPMMLKSLI